MLLFKWLDAKCFFISSLSLRVSFNGKNVNFIKIKAPVSLCTRQSIS